MSEATAKLPLWVQWIQVGATIFIALAATRIAYGQWQTAHQRVLLDLFERRMAMYEAMRDVVAGVLQTGRADHETYFRFLRATDRPHLVFGDE